jgi:hypothetical protein
MYFPRLLEATRFPVQHHQREPDILQVRVPWDAVKRHVVRRPENSCPLLGLHKLDAGNGVVVFVADRNCAQIVKQIGDAFISETARLRPQRHDVQRGFAMNAVFDAALVDAAALFFGKRTIATEAREQRLIDKSFRDLIALYCSYAGDQATAPFFR